MFFMGLINFAIDFGNGYVKAKSDKGSFVIPSKIGYADNIGSTSLGDSLDSETLDIHYYARKDEPTYVAGSDIEKAINPSQLVNTNSANNRYKMVAFKQLVDFSLAELSSYEDSKNIEVRLITGMPSNDIYMKERKEAFERFLLGTHVVERDGDEWVINVKELKIIEQPLGTLLNVYLNDEMRVHKDLQEGTIVVIDFGSGTTIVDIYKNMKRIGGDTLNEGMIKFYKDIAFQASNEYSDKIDSEYIEAGIKNKDFIAKFGEKAYDFKDFYKSMIFKKVQSVVGIYENEIGRESLVNGFLVTGGGSTFIGDDLIKQKGNFKVVDRPQTSTVEGYFKLAKSLGKGE